MIESNPSRVETRRSFLKWLVGLKGEGEEASLGDTVKLTTAYTVGVVATLPAVDLAQKSFSIVIGNQGMDAKEVEKDKQDPGLAFFEGSILAPLLEEPIFRFIPAIPLVLLKAKGPMWRLGAPSSLIFAAAHNLDRNPQTGQIRMKYDAVPIYQFASGMLFWKLMRSRGWLHPIVAHAVFNTWAVASEFVPQKGE